MSYKRKYKNSMKLDLKRYKQKSLTLNTMYNIAFIESYLKDDEYAKWYDNWASSFPKDIKFKVE